MVQGHTHAHEYRGSFEKIVRVFPAGTGFRVLDIGCADGRVAEPLTQQHTVFGLDGSEEALSEAEKRGVKITHGSVEERFPFDDGFFDVILALDILEHVTDIDGFFREIARVARRDATLILSLPNHFDLRTRLEILAGKGIIKWSQRQFEKEAWRYAHVRFLTRSDVRRMLASYGWHPEIWQYNFMSQGLLPTRLMPRLLRYALTRLQPSLWSGKLVVRARRNAPESEQTVILTETPAEF